MSIKSAQAKQQLRNSDGTFANENKNAGLPSNDMIQRASKLLAKSSATVDEPIIKPSVKSEGYMGSPPSPAANTMPVAVRRKTRNSCARTSKHCRRTVNFQKIGRSESEQVQVPQVGEPDSPSNCRKANPPHTCRPTPNIWLRIPKTGSSVRNTGPDEESSKLMEEAPPPTNGMKQHGESTRKSRTTNS